MSSKPDFNRQYADALNDYLNANGEAVLKTAYDLGRRAVTEGVGVLEMAVMHRNAIAERLPGPQAYDEDRATRFLLETLSPYEMTHRGFREANEALQQLNATLEWRVAERTREAEVARAEAEDANRVKSDFLAVMSHEFRTPLNAVLGYAELLEIGISGPLTNRQLEHVKGIKAGADHLLELIEEILTFAKIESGSVTLHWEVVDVASLMQEAAALVEPVASGRDLEFVVVLPPTQVLIQTDARKLRQILINLLSNAVKFTEKGRVALTARLEERWITFEVEDTGIGIPTGHLERVFDSFWQGERAASGRSRGTGLGLSVSRNLARKMGGDITVSSTVGRGSTFRVRLPRSRGPEAVAGAGQGASG